MDRVEREHQALQRIKGWLGIVFPEKGEYRPYWQSHKELLFDIFREAYPILKAGRIRRHLEENWRQDHSDREWETVIKVLDAWEEWQFAWDKHPTRQQGE